MQKHITKNKGKKERWSRHVKGKKKKERKQNFKYTLIGGSGTCANLMRNG